MTGAQRSILTGTQDAQSGSTSFHVSTPTCHHCYARQYCRETGWPDVTPVVSTAWHLCLLPGWIQYW